MQTEMNLVDPDPIEKRFAALRVRQPIGDIYVARVDADTIQQITYFDVRRTLRDERDVERYLGIQRPLSEARVTDLNKYVQFLDATFPTSIIVAVDAEYGRFDEKSGELVVSNVRDGDTGPSIAIRNIGRVIDGQHRIAGLEAFDTSGGNAFDVIVSFFLGSDIADQAYVFATVNLEQTKVNKSLAYDLFELARSRSPYKTAHNVAVALDQVSSSPFYRRIKRLGVATEGRDNSRETITQATFVEGLIRYISQDPRADRDAILRGMRLLPAKKEDARRLVFRNLFITEQDRLIGKIYEEYFAAIAETWPEAWGFAGAGIMLTRTNGYRAFSSIFGTVYNALGEPGEFISRQKYQTLFELVPLKWSDFNTDRFRPGTSGEAELRRLLLSSMRLV